MTKKDFLEVLNNGEGEITLSGEQLSDGNDGISSVPRWALFLHDRHRTVELMSYQGGYGFQGMDRTQRAQERLEKDVL